METYPTNGWPDPALPEDFAPVAALDRAGLVESWHYGMAAVVGPDGQLRANLGSADRAFYPRSAVKPLQAVAMRRAGLHLTGAQLAISVASHHGTEAHTNLVSQVLAGAGLTEADLQCPVAWPGNPDARSAAQSQTRLAFNCSGKHAGFLATCVAAGWDTKTYLQFEHPLQVSIRQALEEYSGEPINFTTVDGCGAPLHVMTVAGLARAMSRLALNDGEICDAMVQNAWAVGDATTPDALLMSEGLIAKLGAEGVMAVTTVDGWGACVKIADGSHRASALVAAKLLHQVGAISGAQLTRLNEKLAVLSLGGATELGRLRAL